MERSVTGAATGAGPLAWRVSRRRFVGGAALAVAAGLLTACGARGSAATTATVGGAAVLLGGAVMW